MAHASAHVQRDLHAWVECCGHLSLFSVPPFRYSSSPSALPRWLERARTERSVAAKIGAVFSHTGQKGNVRLRLRLYDAADRGTGWRACRPHRQAARAPLGPERSAALEVRDMWCVRAARVDDEMRFHSAFPAHIVELDSADPANSTVPADQARHSALRLNSDRTPPRARFPWILWELLVRIEFLQTTASAAATGPPENSEITSRKPAQPW